MLTYAVMPMDHARAADLSCMSAWYIDNHIIWSDSITSPECDNIKNALISNESFVVRTGWSKYFKFWQVVEAEHRIMLGASLELYVCSEVVNSCRVTMQYIRAFLCVSIADFDYRGRWAHLIKSIVADARGDGMDF